MVIWNSVAIRTAIWVYSESYLYGHMLFLWLHTNSKSCSYTVIAGMLFIWFSIDVDV